MKLPYSFAGALAALCLSALDSHGSVIVAFNNVNVPIPDGSLTPVVVGVDVAVPLTKITGLQVHLTLEPYGNAPAYNGDLFVSLTYSTGYAVLLNRAGHDMTNPFGYADSGFDITLAEGAPNVHTYQQTTGPTGSSPLTGTWAPDGRAVNPDEVATSDAVTATLASFDGLDPNGHWTLALADLEQGYQAQLKNWSLEITGVPEPQRWPLVVSLSLAGLGGWRWLRRHG